MIKIEEIKYDLERNLLKLNQSLTKKSEAKPSNEKKFDKNEQLVHILQQNNLFEVTIQYYLKLKSLLESIKTTNCTNLLNYLIKHVQVYHDKLKSLIQLELEAKLKEISYPFITTVSPDKETKAKKSKSQSDLDLEAQLQFNSEQNKLKIKSCIDWLLKIEYSQLVADLNESNKALIIGILTNALEIRFKFHFSGNRKTNNLEKPEWYLSQILKWIKQHEEFLNLFIQPIFDTHSAYKGKPIIIDFVNCFISLIKNKIDHDLIMLIKDEFLFSHTIDELLLFDQQLKSYLKELGIYEKCDNFVSCMNVLCRNEEFFSNWLNLERLICTKKIDKIFAYLNKTNVELADQGTSLSLLSQQAKNSNDIWQCNYSDVDKMKPPQCAETFMSMIKAISDRFSELSNHQTKKLKFVSLQIELIGEFHMRLCQIIRDETTASNSFGKIYLGALNAVNYIISVLDEWKNSTFYIEMHYVRSRFNQYGIKYKSTKQGLVKFETSSPTKSSENEFETDLELCRLFDNQYLNNETSFYNLNSLFDLNGTLFDEVLSSYESIKDDMLSTIIKNCLWEIKTRSRNYKKEKWISMPLFSDFYKTTLTQSAADMLISLKNLLNLLKESLAQYLFETALKRIATELDKFFYEEIIMKNQFNDGGVSQFDHDFNKYLLPILNEYSLNDSISDNFFRKTKEALILLKLKQGPAILLKDIIYSALHSETSNRETDQMKLRVSNRNLTTSTSRKETHDDARIQIYNAKNALKEFGIVQLTCEQAEEILHLRSYGETI